MNIEKTRKRMTTHNRLIHIDILVNENFDIGEVGLGINDSRGESSLALLRLKNYKSKKREGKT
jgi:hypothetical protein